jgi:acyl carrier protein
MKREEIVQVVLSTFRQVIRDAEKTMDRDADETTALLGSDSPFDSVDLVTFIVALEQTLEDEHNVSVILADDRAMSQTESPFRSIASVSDYIYMLINEK